MDSNSGLPPEILVLCTTTETKEKAVQLLDWIRHIPDTHGELAWEPAIPAICSLIASEQLGNTVVTERRAQQWSQSTPEHFRAVMGEVQKLLISSRMHRQPQKGCLTLQALVAEFCSDQNALSRVMMVEKAFGEANGKERWHLESDLVQLSLFVWSCRQLKIRTLRPVEEIQQSHGLPTASFNEIQNFLDEHCLSTFIESNASPLHITVLSASQESSRPPVVFWDDAAKLEESSSGSSAVRFEDLAHEFGVADDAIAGMRFLDSIVRDTDDFKDLVNWSSTMGRCVIFYWTCSVLKIPGAKHITLRNRFQLAKKDFDKILSELDHQRGDLRKELESFCAMISPSKPQYAPDLVIEKSASPTRKISRQGSGKRGRPPKPKSPTTIYLDPVSEQEHGLLSLCTDTALRRALLLLRSFNAKRRPTSEADRIPHESVPPIIALFASKQLGNGQVNEQQAMQASGLPADDFATALYTVGTAVDVYRTAEIWAPQTIFDDLALEHGLAINTVVTMMFVREGLKASRCLSVGMDWDSPLVKWSIFFWTCAILKVPSFKPSLIRSRSLVSKREFDSMLQLLNSHCSTVREQLEYPPTEIGYFFAPPPYTSQRPNSRRYSALNGEQDIETRNGKPVKRIRRDTITLSSIGSEAFDSHNSYSYVQSKKRGRPPGFRKALQRDDGSPGTGTYGVQDVGPIYVPTIQFPPPDWKPPESLSHTISNGFVSSTTCPSSETGDSKRRHTRYSTTDYQGTGYARIEVWKPDGEEILEQQRQYRRWEDKMAQHYGTHWERNISHEKPGIPFE